MLLSIQFDKAMWFCLWNSDQNCITKLCAPVGDESPVASRVQGGRTFMLK